MHKIHDSTQVSVTWKPFHQREQERMSELSAQAHIIGMTREKVPEVVSDLRNLDNQRAQRLIEQGRLEPQIRQGGIVDVYA